MKFGLGIGLPQKRSTRIWLALAIIVLLIAGGSALLWYTARGMFQENPRFVLRHIVINSNGYWNGREKHLCYLLKIKTGTTNMFSLEPAKMRSELLKKEPGIEKVSVRRILPDTLVFDITERIPRAFINAPMSHLLLDGEGVVIEREKCINLNQNLPVLHGIRNEQKLTPGQKPENIEAALELIMLALTEYPDIRIALVSILTPRQLICGIYYKDKIGPGDSFRVYMQDRNLRNSIRRLLPALEEIRSKGSKSREIDLLYENQCVVR